jgi:hypothetical protein
MGYSAVEFQEIARRIDSMPLSTISDAGLMARMFETSRLIATTKEEALIGASEATQLLIKRSHSCRVG